MPSDGYTSEERLLAALDQREPDRVPLDLGGATTTGIAAGAYRDLLDYLGMSDREVEIIDPVQQLARPHEEVLEKFGADVRGIKPRSVEEAEIQEGEKYEFFTDEWGFEWRMPKESGFYFDIVSSPLSGDIEVSDIEDFDWPEPDHPKRFEGLAEEAEEIKQKEKGLIMNHWAWGIFELSSWLRGPEQFYKDLVTQPELASCLLDKVVELKLDFWNRALESIGSKVDVIKQNDDLGGQDNLLISPEMYRKFLKPRHRKIFDFLKSNSDARIFFHSCGAIYELIPELIETGIDILNPVQLSAGGMDAKKLKREFGENLTFWGGGVDTQKTLPRGSEAEVQDEVKRNIETFAPGGGFVFSAIHNIQSDVPPENIVAMLETFREYATY